MLLEFGAGEEALLSVNSGIMMANFGFAQTGHDPTAVVVTAATPPKLS